MDPWFSVLKIWQGKDALAQLESTCSLLFEKPKIIRNGPLFMILERIFDDES